MYYEPRPDRPSVLGSSRGEVDVGAQRGGLRREGSPYFAVRTEDGVVAIFVPHDMFAWPLTAIDGVPIRTLSPLALIQIRTGLTATAAFGPPGRARTRRVKPAHRGLLSRRR